jgi:hypothetical protein
MLRSAIFIFDISVIKGAWNLYVHEMDNRDDIFFSYIVNSLSEMYGLTFGPDTSLRNIKVPLRIFNRNDKPVIDHLVFVNIKIPSFDNYPSLCDINIIHNDLFVYFH